MTAMVFRRRRLPHQDVEGHPIFITGCLDGSLSANGFSRIEKYREQLDTRPRPDELTLQQWEERKQKLLFAFVDYIEQNPVKAVLVSSAADYLFSSARIRKQLGLAAGQAIPEVALASSLR